MRCNSVIVFMVWFVLCAQSTCVAECDSEIAASQDPFSLELRTTRKGRKSIKFLQNETISLMDGDQLSIKCTTRNVHVWEGILDHQKFIHKIGTIKRNSNAGHFTSFVNMTVQSTVLFSNWTSLICKELGKNRNTAKCIHFHSEREKSSNEDEKEGKQNLLVTVDTCPQNAMDENKNFTRPKNTQNLPVLILRIPNYELVDGAIVKFYGKASKHTIIQSPEVLITSKDGKDLRLDVEILPETENKTKGQYYTFKMVANLTVNMKTIKLVGYRYHSSEPIVVKKDLNVTVGLPPKIEGLPSKIEIYRDNSDNYFRFRVFGQPHPKLTLYFKDEPIDANDRRFGIYQHAVGNYTFHIRKMDNERVVGKFKIRASNLIGKTEVSIKFQANCQWTLAEARMIGYGVFVALFSLVVLCTCVMLTSKCR